MTPARLIWICLLVALGAGAATGAIVFGLCLRWLERRINRVLGVTQDWQGRQECVAVVIGVDPDGPPDDPDHTGPINILPEPYAGGVWHSPVDAGRHRAGDDDDVITPPIGESV